LAIADSESQSLTENGTEDDMDTDVRADNGCHGDSAAEVAASGAEASVNTARVSVRQLALHLTAIHFQSLTAALDFDFLISGSA